MAGRILIADDVATNRIILRARLGSAAYQTELVASGAEILRLANAAPPELILIGDQFDDMSGLEVCQHLRTMPKTTNLPLIVMSSDSSRDYRLEALRAGADAVLDKLPDDGLLRALIRSLLRRGMAERELSTGSDLGGCYGFAEAGQAEFTRQGQIALIAPNLAEGLKWRNGLKDRLRDRISVLDPVTALQDLNDQNPPDAIVVAECPDEPDHATQLIADLRCRSETQRTAIVLVQFAPNAARASAALDLGANDISDHGFNPGEVALLLRRGLARKTRNDTRREALQNGLRLASVDPLTGLFNRRYALDQLDQITRHASDTGDTFAVMVLDLDRFKRINDQYGHPTGDAVLKDVAERMAGCLRRDDFLARIGGEEFLAVIRSCSLQAAQHAAERLRSVVADSPVDLPGDKGSEQMTVSIGLVIGGEAGMPEDPAALVELADRGLYVAKADGRNQVTVCEVAA